MTNNNILIITYWNYEDALIQTYTLPYVKIIQKYLPKDSKIYLVTLEKQKKNDKPFNLPIGIFHIPLNYYPFGIKAAFEWYLNYRKLKKIIKKEKISTIHAWCTPAGAIAYFLSKKTNTELIVDSFEPHAEAMVENGSWKRKSMAFKLLFRLEKKQTFHAKFLIAASYGMENYAEKKYGFTGKNMFFKPACTDLDLFNITKRKNASLLKKLNLEDKIVCVYAGKFGGIYLEEEIFDFILSASNYFGEKFRFLLLSNYSIEKRKKIEHIRQINENTIVQLFIPHEQMPEYLGLADFAITPVKPVPTKLYCSPIKNGEYWAMGLPVIITKNISQDSKIIKTDNIGFVLENYSESDFLQSFKKIKALLDEKPQTQKRLINAVNQYRSFSIAENIYRSIYSSK